jgi:hypothetical protein
VPEDKKHLQNIGIDGRIILTWIVKEQVTFLDWIHATS